MSASSWVLQANQVWSDFFKLSSPQSNKNLNQNSLRWLWSHRHWVIFNHTLSMLSNRKNVITDKILNYLNQLNYPLNYMIHLGACVWIKCMTTLIQHSLQFLNKHSAVNSRWWFMVVILQHGATLTLRFHAEIKQTVGALTESVSSGGCSLFFIAATSTPLAALDKLGNSLPHLNTHMQKNTLSQIISTCQNSFFASY